MRLHIKQLEQENSRLLKDNKELTTALNSEKVLALASYFSNSRFEVKNIHSELKD